MIANGDTGVRLITPAQRRKLFAVRRELGLTDAAFYYAMHTLLGKTSVRSLTVHEAAAFIDELLVRPPSEPGRQLRSGPQKAPDSQVPPSPQRPSAPERREAIPQRPTGTVIHLATDEQLVAIETLLQSLGWGWDAAEFTAIVRKAGIRRGIRTQAEAAGVIEALEGIARREEAGPRPDREEGQAK